MAPIKTESWKLADVLYKYSEPIRAEVIWGKEKFRVDWVQDSDAILFPTSGGQTSPLTSALEYLAKSRE